MWAGYRKQEEKRKGGRRREQGRSSDLGHRVRVQGSGFTVQDAG
jgi:hypothetical protein